MDQPIIDRPPLIGSSMDWYFDGEIDDCIVPNDLEILEAFYEKKGTLLENDWLPFGGLTLEGVGSPIKRGKLDASEQGSSISDGWPDHQLQNLCERTKHSESTEEMDEIFLNSLLKDDSRDLEYPYLNEAIGTLPNTERSSMTGVSFLTDEDNEDCPLWHFTPLDDGIMEVLPTEKVEAYSEEESLEAAVLQELKGTMSQLNQDTRICLRDAFYRLAKSSRQRHTTNLSGTEFNEEQDSLDSRNKRLRHCNSPKMESETNVIDRTIMNLLFQ